MTLKDVLQIRDKMSESEAEQEITDMKNRVWDGEDPEAILDSIGLEPDYIFDILPI